MTESPSVSGRRRLAGLGLIALSIAAPIGLYLAIRSVAPGVAWIGPVVWFFAVPGWFVLWAGVSLVHRGDMPGLRRRP